MRLLNRYERNVRDCLTFLAIHALCGYVLSALATGGILLSDLSGIGTLVARSDVGWLAAFMLFAFLGTTLAACQITFALLLGFDDEDDGPRGGKLQRLWFPILVPARIRRR